MQRFARGVGLAVVALALAACGTGPTAPEPHLGREGAPVGGACAAAAAQGAIGKSAGPRVVEQARVASGARMARVLHPGQIVTREFNGERLNLEVDARGVVVAVRCG
ncbi:MAG: I78 family peptidase inhibitor [Comamonadaceae bacterium]|nr:proteinase inhibitor I78 [Burkholderiales bacterium]MEB2349600.1 I78 family peptidase inhibitor [Comamonadaceae bacterium]